MSERVKATCELCGKEFDMGYTGVSPAGVDMCDSCAGISREPEGIGMLRGIVWALIAAGFLAALLYAAVTL